MNRSRTMLFLVGGSVTLSLFGACAGGGSARVGDSSVATDVPAGGEPEGVYHNVTEADKATTRGGTPIAGPYVKLWVNGMGCPQCVTNVDLQLERQFKATDIRVDLETGVVYAHFPAKRPSPDQLTHAVTDAGVTLVKVQAAEASLDPMSAR